MAVKTKKPTHTEETIELFSGRTTGNPDVLMLASSSYFSIINGRSARDVMPIYDEMMLDDKISQVFRIIDSSVMSLRYDLESDNQAAADFVKENLEKIQYDSWIEDLLEARRKGYQVSEKIWEIKGGKYYLERMKYVPQDMIDFSVDKFGNLETVNFNGIPQDKGMFHVFTYPRVKAGNYYGQSDLRSIYREYYSKKILKQYRNIGLENFGFPVVICVYDETMYKKGSENYNSLMSMVRRLKDDARIALPGKVMETGEIMPGARIEFLQPNFAGGGFNAFKQAIDDEDKAIARNLGLPDDLGFSTTGTGSNAKARTQLDMYWDMVIGIAKRVQTSIQEVIDELVNYNFPDTVVKFKFDYESDDGLTEEKSRIILSLRNAGVNIPDEFLTSYLGFDATQTADLSAQNTDKTKESGKAPVTISTGTPAIENVQAAALNGAQVTSLVDIASKVATGQLPLESAKAIAKAAFPLISAEDIDSIFKSLASFKPEDTPKESGGFDSKKKRLNFQADNRIDRVVNYARIENALDMIENDATEKIGQEVQTIVDTILKKIDKLSPSDVTVEKLDGASKAKIKKAYSWMIIQSYFKGKEEALLELEKKGVNYSRMSVVYQKFTHQKTMEYFEKALPDQPIKIWIDEWCKSHGVSLNKYDKEYISRVKDWSFTAVQGLSEDIAREVRDTLNTQVDYKNPDQISATIIESLGKSGYIGKEPHHIRTTVRTSSSQYFNNARMNMFNDPAMRGYITGYQYSAVMDSRTTFFCEQHNGEIIAADDPQLINISPPAHFNCRSILVPITQDDGKIEPDWGKKPMTSAEYQEAYGSPAEGFGGKGRVNVSKSRTNGIEARGDEPKDPEVMPVEYIEAASAKEAAAYIKENDFADNVNYNKFDAKTANEFNKSVVEHVSKFPELRKNLTFIGSAQERNKYYIEKNLPDVMERYKKVLPGASEKLIEKYARAALRKSIGSVDSRILAISINEPTIKGITINEVYGKNAELFQANYERTLKDNVASKFHPIGCDTIKSVLDHELGHQLDDMLGISNNKALKDLYSAYTKSDEMKTKLTEELSAYAWKNRASNKIKEFVAEGWAEYLNNPTPRPLAKAIGETIEKEYKLWTKKQ